MNKVSMSPSEGDVNHTTARSEWRRANISPETAVILAEDEKYFLHQSLSTPCLDVIIESSGSTMTDVQGRKFLDFHGNSVHQIGYGHPKVIQAIKGQLDALPFSPRRFTNEPSIHLAKKLVEITPMGLDKVLFCPGGAEAIGIAMKLARIATGKYKTVSFWDSFHGASLDASSIGGEEIFRKGLGPLLPGSEHISPPTPRSCLFGCEGRCSLRCADYLEYVLEKEGDVGALVAEPMRCTTVQLPPPGYWQRIREICDRYRVLLIFDEIPIGLGRTGAMFACEAFDVIPDILVIGKGLGGGIMPLAAVIARQELNVAGAWALGHYTHEKSPVAAAAGLATIEVIEEERLVERSRILGAQVLAEIRSWATTMPLIREVRGMGLLIGVELQAIDERSPSKLSEETMYSALEKGLNFKVSDGNVLTLTPPLNITEEELRNALRILKSALEKVIQTNEAEINSV